MFNRRWHEFLTTDATLQRTPRNGVGTLDPIRNEIMIITNVIMINDYVVLFLLYMLIRLVLLLLSTLLLILTPLVLLVHAQKDLATGIARSTGPSPHGQRNSRAATPLPSPLDPYRCL